LTLNYNDDELRISNSLCQVEILHVNTINITKPTDNEIVIVATRKTAKEIGFSEVDEVMIATASSELSTNIVRYAGEGKLLISKIKKHKNIGIQLEAVDYGTGIHDVNKVIQENYSSKTRSLGMGLPSVIRIMDDTMIESEMNKGTHITTRKWYK